MKPFRTLVEYPVLAILFLLPHSSVFSQSSFNVELLSQQTLKWGAVGEIAFSGNLAIVATSRNTYILDVSDPVNMICVGQIPEAAPAHGVAVDETTLFIACDSIGLVIASIENPARPTVLSILNTPGRAWDVSVSEGVVFIAADDFFMIADVSNLEQPRGISGMEVQGSARKIIQRDSLVFLAAIGSWVKSINVAQLESPSELSQWQSPGAVNDIDLYQNYFLAATDSGSFVVDISNPEEPATLLQLGNQRGAKSIGVSRSLCLVSTAGGDVIPFNISDMRRIREREGLNLRNYNEEYIREIAFHNDTLFSASNYSSIFAFTPPAIHGGRILGVFRTDIYSRKIELAGDYAIVAGNIGLLTLNISDPIHPFSVAFCKTPSDIFDLSVIDDIAYLATYYGLTICDISDPLHVRVLNTYFNQNYGYQALAVNEGMVYAGTYSGRLHLLDASDFENMSMVSELDVSACGIIYSEGYLFLKNGGVYNDPSSFTIVEVSDPRNPVTRATCNLLLERYCEMQIAQDLLYASVRGSGIVVYDISDRANPMRLREFGSRYTALNLLGERMFLKGMYLDVLSLAVPEHPMTTGYHHNSYGGSRDIAISGDLIYLIGTGTISIFDCHDAIHANVGPAWWQYPQGDSMRAISGSVFEFEVIAHDPNLDSLTLRMNPGNLPDNATFTDHGNGQGTFHWQSLPDPRGSRYFPYFIADDGEFSDSIPVLITTRPNNNSVEALPFPSSHELLSASPNPFNSELNITSRLPVHGEVTITLYSSQGRLLTSLFDGRMNSGSHRMVLDASELPAGIYLLQMESPIGSKTLKLCHLR